MTTEKTLEKTTKTAKPKCENRTPAAIMAANRGEETFVFTVKERYPGDYTRYLKVDANPECYIPTEEEVEVAENEYYELKNSEKLRKELKERIKKLERNSR